MRLLFFAIFLFFGYTASFSQNEWNIWNFGINAGLDFATSPPTVIPSPYGIVTTGLGTTEGSAGISDGNGNSLFFTDGINVWDASNNIMSNGTGLMGNPSSSQCAIIVPKPGTYNSVFKRFDTYFLFTVDAYASDPLTSNYGVRYSEVDMTANGGLGAITANKNIHLFGTETTERITSSIHSNLCDYWVIGKDAGTDAFYSYKVDENGVNMTPVISNTGPVSSSNCGQLKTSSDNTLIGMADCSDGFFLFDFDNSTGILAFKYSDLVSSAYSVEFSPDATKLYGSAQFGGTNGIYQYDATAANQGAFTASKQGVGGGSYPSWGIQLAPDNKIYVCHWEYNPWGTPLILTALSSIDNPNLSGTACNFNYQSVNLAPGENSLALPNFPQIFIPDPTDLIHVFDAVTLSDTICNDQVVFELADTAAVTAINWYYANSSTPTNIIDSANVLSPTFINILPGTYNVTAVVEYNCWTFTLDTVFTYNPFTLNLDSTGAICSNGNVDLIVTGGENPFSFIWSTGSTNEDLTGVASGQYSVTVTDNLGCNTTGTVSVLNTTNNVTPDILGNDFCTGSTSVLDAGTGFSTYLWSNSLGNSQTASINLAGVYYVTVTDSDGCLGYDSILVSEIASIIPVITGNDICGVGDTSVLDAGTGYNSYTWSNSLGSTQTVYATAMGTYYVTVIDNNNCTAIDTITINQFPGINIDATPQNISCYGLSDGSINISTSGGNSPYTFLWDNSSTTESISNLSENTYTLTVTDVNNCTQEYTSVINEPSEFTSSINHTNILCFGETNGEVSITVNGGTGSYTYTWNNGANTQNISNLTDGTYSITVTDANNCTTINSAEVLTVDQPLLVNYSEINNICFGNNEGIINTTTSGGTPPYSYNWNNGSSNENLADLYTGTYYLTVNDINNCSEEITVTITEPTELIVSLPANTIICQNSDLNIQSSTTGGNTPYTYAWNTGNTLNNININITDSTFYTITVTDGNNCNTTQSIAVNTYSLPNITASTDIDSVCPGNPINISTSIIGGLQPYTVFNNGQIASLPITTYPNGQESFTLQVVDACGKTDNSIVNINMFPSLPLSFNSDILNGCQPLAVNFNEINNCESCVYNWDFGDGTSNNTSLIHNPKHIFEFDGTYSVSINVIDKNGCENQLTISNMIEVYPLPDAKFNAYPDVVTVLVPEIKFTNLSIGNYYNYWFFGDGQASDYTNPVHKYNSITNYTVTLIVETDKGCLDSVYTVVQVKDVFTIYVPTAFSPDNDGINDGFKVVGHGIDTDNFELRIYDRWGETIWKSNDLFEEWDGIPSDANNIVQTGTYKWLAICRDLDGIEYTRSGNVTVIR